jgi:hypothetical protein
MIQLSRPIAYSVNLARVTGEAKACLFLSQLVYWTRVGIQVVEHGGWIFKTRSEWTIETGLSRAEQETARKRLVAAQFIQEQRVGAPARSCFRVDLDKLGVALAKVTKTQVEQLELLEVRSSSARIRVLFGANLAFHRTFVELTGSVTTAIYLARVVQLFNYMTRVNTDRNRRFNKGSANKSKQDPTKPQRFDDWFSVDADQWIRDTGLTAAQQRRAQAHLVKLEVVQEALQSFPRRKVFIRLNEARLASALAEYQTAKFCKPNTKASKVTVTKIETETDSVQSNQTEINAGVKTRLSLTVASAQNGNGDVQNLLCQNSPSSFTEKVKLEGEFSHICTDKQLNNPKSTVSNIKYSNYPDEVQQNAEVGNRYPLTQNAELVNNLIDVAISSDSTLVSSPDTFSANRSVLTSHTASFNVSSRRVLASLRARGRVNDYISITTTTKDQSVFVNPKVADQTVPVVVVAADAAKAEKEKENVNVDDGLIWSMHLEDAELQICKSRLSGLRGVSKAKQQELVDEFTGNLSDAGIRHPVRYFTALIKRFQSGEFVPDMAHEVASLRESNARFKARMRQLNRDLPSTESVTVTGSPQSTSFAPSKSAEEMATTAAAASKARAQAAELSKKWKAESLQKNSMALAKNQNQAQPSNQGNHGNHP